MSDQLDTPHVWPYPGTSHQAPMKELKVTIGRLRKGKRLTSSPVSQLLASFERILADSELTESFQNQFMVDTASSFADRSDWDGRYYLRSLNGTVNWESARHTSRGGSIRLMRLDNATLKVHCAYVPLSHQMRLVTKTQP